MKLAAVLAVASLALGIHADHLCAQTDFYETYKPAVIGDSTLRKAPFAEKMWSVSPSERIRWHKLSPAGDLILGSDSGLICLDDSTGSINWTISLAGLSRARVEFLPWTPLAAAYPVTGQDSALSRMLIELRDREAPKSQIAKTKMEMTRTEMVMLDIEKGRILWNGSATGLTRIAGAYYLRQMNAVLVFGRLEESSKPALALVDIENGRPYWRNSDLYGDSEGPAVWKPDPDDFVVRESILGNQPPLCLSDSTFLEMFSTSGLRRIDARTGQVIWRSSITFKGVPAPRDGYAALRLSPDGESVYVPQGDYLHKVNLRDGSLIWDNPARLPSHVSQFEITSGGIVVRGERKYLNAIEDSDGSLKWKKFTKWQVDTPFLIEGDSVIYAGNKGLVSTYRLAKYSIATGQQRIILKKGKFEGREAVQFLTKTDSGYVVSGWNNADLVDSTGKIVFHKFFKAPGLTALAQVAIFTATWGVNAAIGNTTLDYPIYSYSAGLYHTDVYWMPWIDPIPLMRARWIATTRADQHLYVLTNVTGGSSGNTKHTGLVKLNLTSGEVASRVALGEKSPNYRIDEFLHHLFFISEANIVSCYNF